MEVGSVFGGGSALLEWEHSGSRSPQLGWEHTAGGGSAVGGGSSLLDGGSAGGGRWTASVTRDASAQLGTGSTAGVGSTIRD